MTSGPLPSSRRTFLQLAGATAFALPATARAYGGVPRIQREEVHMEIKRIGTQPSGKGPAEWFTGSVRIDPLFQPQAPARAAGASVTFEPGDRTAWHTHPLGQTLLITAGCGWVQREGGEIHWGDETGVRSTCQHSRGYARPGETPERVDSRKVSCCDRLFLL